MTVPFYHRFEPRDLAELQSVLPDLAQMISRECTRPLALQAAMLAARHFGSVWAAPDVVYLHRGKVTLRGSALAAIMASSGKITIAYDSRTAERVTVRASREGFGEVVADWPISRAKKYAQTNAQYQTAPIEMLTWRAIGEIARLLAGDLIGSGVVEPDDVPTQEETAAVIAEAAAFGPAQIVRRFSAPVAEPTPTPEATSSRRAPDVHTTTQPEPAPAPEPPATGADAAASIIALCDAHGHTLTDAEAAAVRVRADGDGAAGLVKFAATLAGADNAKAASLIAAMRAKIAAAATPAPDPQPEPAPSTKRPTKPKARLLRALTDLGDAIRYDVDAVTADLRGWSDDEAQAWALLIETDGIDAAAKFPGVTIP